MIMIMKRILIILTVLLLGGLRTAHISAQTMTDYTAYPPFMMSSATPNILIIQDNSGSMNRPAYDNDDDYTTIDNDFDPNKTYYGYFDPFSKYAYGSGIAGCGGEDCFYPSGPGQWSGNFLNWVTMRRIDIARKVLVGGKAVTRSPGADPYALTGEAPPDNGACCRQFIKQYNDAGAIYTPHNGNYYYCVQEGKIAVDPSASTIYSGGCRGKNKDNTYQPCAGTTGIHNIRVQIDSTPLGIIQKMGNNVRFGLEVFNDTEGGRIERYINFGDYVYTDNKTHIEHLVDSVENLHPKTWTPLGESLYEGARYFSQKSPYYTVNTPSDYEIDANTYKDPYYFTDIGGKVSCCESFVIMITDGESTEDDNIPVGSDLPAVASWAYTTDLRALDGEQNLTLYTISAFGAGSQLLQDAADNGGGKFFEAQEGEALEASILGAIDSIIKQTMSSASTSVVTTSGSGEGSLFQAYFMPSKDGVDWLGYLQALWVDPGGNLREDSDCDGKQILTEDKIVELVVNDKGETEVWKYQDSNGDGVPDGSPQKGPLYDIIPIWEAGKKLANMNVSARKIYAVVDTNEDGWCKNTWAPCSQGEGEFIEFKDTNASTLKPYLRADGTGLYTADNIINFIRGEGVSGLRDRTVDVDGTAKVWRLGDIVYSTPTVVGRPMENMDFIYADEDYLEFYNKYRDRETVVYAGANDGMLHAFRAGVYHTGDDPGTDEKEYGWYEDSNDNRGEELWAYIPYDLLPHLKWLTDPNYTHVYYVDLKTKVLDAKIFDSDADHPGGWGTVLVGGMRFGGGELTINNFNGSGSARTFRSAYFALDITVPSSPRFLWRFTHPDLAFTMSYPAVAKIGANTNNWYVFVGSGPTDYNGTSDQTASIFVLNLRTGRKLAVNEAVKVYNLVESNAFMANPITVDVDLKIDDVNGSYATDVIYIGETYKESGVWKGKMLRISKTDNSTWEVSSLYETNPGQSISTAPAVAMDGNQNLWVYFGTGKFLGRNDKTDTNVQSFYGIMENCWDNVNQQWTNGCYSSAGNLYDSTNVVVYEGGELKAGGTLDELVTKVKTDYDGWRIDFSVSGERVLSKPVIFGGMVLFTTFAPNTNICGDGGDGYLYALYYETGTAYKESIFGTESDAEAGKEKVLIKVPLGVGIPSSVGLHIGTEETLAGGGSGGIGVLDVSCGSVANSSGSKITAFMQGSSGQITQQTIETALSPNSRVISWKER